MSDTPAPRQSLSGSCLCRASTFTIANTPIRMVVCHCNNFKKWSGSAFATNIHFPKSALTLKDSLKIRSYVDGDTKSGRGIERHFCGDCGCSLYIIGPHKPEVVNIASGVLDGFIGTAEDNVPKVDEEERLAGLHPHIEVYVEDKCPWLNVTVDKRSEGGLSTI